MVFGNRDDRSGTGVGFTRDPATGAPEPYGDFLVNAQGEDVVAGIRATDPLVGMADRLPEAHAELLDVFSRLERHYRDMCDVEFTVEQDRLWILQTRAGKRSGAAACASPSTWSPTSTSALSVPEALRRVSADHLSRCCTPSSRPPGERGPHHRPRGQPGRSRRARVPELRRRRRGRDQWRGGDPRPVGDRASRSVHGMMVTEGIAPPAAGLVSHAGRGSPAGGGRRGSSGCRGPSRSGRDGVHRRDVTGGRGGASAPSTVHTARCCSVTSASAR
jgi:pyruvate,orthophosphate dikinase